MSNIAPEYDIWPVSYLSLDVEIFGKQAQTVVKRGKQGKIRLSVLLKLVLVHGIIIQKGRHFHTSFVEFQEHTYIAV